VPIQKIARDGATTYKVQKRRRGLPSVFKTFDRYSEAKAFEERSQREQKVRAALGCNVNLTVREVIEAYLESDEYAKLRSDRSSYLAHWKKWSSQDSVDTRLRALRAGFTLFWADAA
jgi:hypothetical protein